MTRPVETSELEDRLAHCTRLRRKTLRRYFQSIGMFNGHPHMLFHLRRHPGITQKELAAHLEISPASVAISIRRLEAAGLVRREVDGKDGRVMHLYLTPAGEEMDTACSKGRDFMIASLYEGFTQEEKDTLYALLDKVLVNLQAACDTLPPAVPEKG